MRLSHFSSMLAVCIVMVLTHIGNARDLRNVTEPKTPQTCTSLKATGGDDTAVIQKALASCAKGKAVALSTGTFYSGPLTIPSGVSLLVDKGVTLKAIPNPKLFDTGLKTCGTVDNSGFGCKAFITMVGAKSSGIYGKGIIDGQGGEKMTGTNTTWWKLSRIAMDTGRFQNNPRLIQINDSTDITVYQITLTNSPFYHLTSSKTNGFTVWGIFINSSHATRNTDGIDPTGSQNVTIAHCNISTIDDNIAISAMIAPVRHVSVYNNYLNHGNGLAIGSATNFGVSDVTFTNLTLNDLTYGIYVKSDTKNGGLVTNITYDNICIYRVRYPIALDMFYYNQTGNLMPRFKNIVLKNVRIGTNGSYILHGISDSDPIEVNMTDVHVTKGSPWSVSHAKISGAWKDDNAGRHCRQNGNI
uniref:Glycoside hydrolase family 28 n=1 Tax=Medauroidea extradentata TaxID=614211 RepID=A0A191XT09_9NEOP|nr:glycoside hydrolase family 28 [Medauroidea extradentata]